jgi:ferric-dicitrate binding protein FerR (iron transport regulator)
MNDSEPNPLRDHLDRLSREIPPARDLWPEIQAEVERLDLKTLPPVAPSALRSTRSPFRRLRLPLAIAASVAFAAGLYWLRPPAAPSADGWEVSPLAGMPQVGRIALAGPGRLAVGQWLETDDNSRATVSVGQIGEVQLEPNSRLRLLNASATDHRLELARGTLSALIWAPPRLFFVETPTATAIDLGCAYTLTVDDHGAGVLEVTAGYVALEHAGHESIIPAGLMCRTRPGAGPGTPYSVNATSELRSAIDRFDTGEIGALDPLVMAAGADDAITLWHLLGRAPSTARGPVFDKLASFQPPPEGVTRAGILAGEKSMRDRWGRELGLGIALAIR